MKKTIKLKIQKMQAQAEFGVDILPRRRGRANTDFIKRSLRDENGNQLTQDGEIILSRVHTEMGETMTPSEQYKRSTLRKRILGLED